MASNQLPDIAAETAASVSEAIKESGNSLAEVSRRTLIPYVTLHRKTSGKGDLTVGDLATISIAIDRPFLELLPRRLTWGKQ